VTLSKVNRQTSVGLKSTGWICRTATDEEFHKINITAFVILAKGECKWPIKTVSKDLPL